ncbi:hypothetical protein PHSY_004324 [Pseudozyma hubeiensis SY62]|uniref:BLUF domain-containing protein n=1 Tax=Pseudozyma hubeiensis (strain SY62) TaxID=1305764 RepID=R9PF77_PSEHS|nr:hypothetical protein PHSY_004324 [Pseudozyma hubeiensis SY62]GAC96740.1 hypothetical protein PHSY_004324 [Pseudozyma hubeiensis SY62]
MANFLYYHTIHHTFYPYRRQQRLVSSLLGSLFFCQESILEQLNSAEDSPPRLHIESFQSSIFPCPSPLSQPSAPLSNSHIDTMLHQRSTSSTFVGPMGGTRPTVHSEHPPSVPRFAQHNPYDGGAADSFSTARTPASFTRSASSRNTNNLIPAKRPSSGHSSRQSSSDSIESVTTASSFTRASPSSSDFGSGEEDDLIQVVYTSSARSRLMSIDEVKSILRASRANNTAKGITGLLLYRDGSFAQFLEGPAHAVDSLYDTIERDQRHHGVIRVLRQSVTKRDFRQWSMAFRDLDMLKRRSPSSFKFDEDDGELAPEEAVNEGFSQLMNVGLRAGDASDNEYRPDAMGNAKLDLPADMSASMRRLVTTFYRLMDRPL